MVSTSVRGWNENDSRMPLPLCMAVAMLTEAEMEVFSCLQDSDREWNLKRRDEKRRPIRA